jgi:NAD(P)H-binding
VDSADRFSFSFWLAIRAIKLLQRSAYDNLVHSAEVLQCSGLEWTLVRLPMLTDKETSPPPVAGYIGAPKIKLFSLSRNVLADFLVLQLQDDTRLRKAPAISNRNQAR